MINLSPQEFDQTMDWLADISEKEGPGTTRPLYSRSWVEAQNGLKEKFEALGMTVEFDAIGNLYATLEGTEEPETIIATGSHVDSVINGGRLDGQLGIIAGYLSVKHLIEEHGQPKKTLRVISLAEEEGSRFPYVFWGSKNLFNLQNNDEMTSIKDSEGVAFVDAMHEAGFDFQTEPSKFSHMDAFIELHIEQGNFLEQEKKQVGVVDAIVGQKRWNITLKGQANHAGTTLMRYRKDTVECFSRIVVDCLAMAREVGDPLVLTFGHVAVQPNSVNVVPGETVFSMDCRHTDQETLNQFTERVKQKMNEISGEMGIEIEINEWMDEPPVPMDQEIVQLLREVCEENDMNYQQMHSGAGHDSQIFAPRVPTAMLFVPSIGGISHNPAEHTEAKDVVEGIKTLAEALRRLAY